MKKINFYIFGTFLAVTFFFVIIEFTTRTVSYFSGRGFSLSLHEFQATDRPITKIYQWHPFIGFTFTPNYEFQASHPNQRSKSIIKIDRHGFLSNVRDYDFIKSADEIRIATIGGSTTANLNLPYEANWPGQLGKLLQEAYPRKKITILNAGVPGFDTGQSIGNLALRVMPFSPDIVTIYHAYNDLKAIRADTKFSPDYSHVHRTSYGYRTQPGILKRLLIHSMFYVRVRNKYRDYVSLRNKYDKLTGDENSKKARKKTDGEETRLADIPKIRSCFFKADESKTINCVSATALAPYIEASIKRNHYPT